MKELACVKMVKKNAYFWNNELYAFAIYLLIGISFPTV